jgi:hypothetical protein
VDVLAGVVEVHDLGGGRESFIGDVPDPRGAIAEDHELADVLAAAAAGFGVHEAGETGGGSEGGQIAGRARAAYRVAFLLGLGEQAGELDLAGVCLPVSALTGSASRVPALANGTAAAARATIARKPGDIEARATASSPSLGATPCPQAAQ